MKKIGCEAIVVLILILVIVYLLLSWGARFDPNFTFP